MELVKRENERIMRAQEGLNQILTKKIQTEGRGKRAESKDTIHQHKFKKMKQTKNESSSSSEVFGDQRNYHSTSDSSEDNHYTKKENINPMVKFMGSLKRLNHQHSMEKLIRGRKRNPGYLG